MDFNSLFVEKDRESSNQQMAIQHVLRKSQVGKGNSGSQKMHSMVQCFQKYKQRRV